MKKNIFILVISILIITGLSEFQVMAREMIDFNQYKNDIKKNLEKEQSAKNIADIFSFVVLEKVEDSKTDIKSTLDNNPALSSREKLIVGNRPEWSVFHKRQEFSFQVVSLFLDSGISEARTELIINKFANVYAMLLVEIVRGRSVESSLAEYLYEAKGLMNAENLSENVQQKINALISEHFEEMRNTLKKVTAEAS